MILHSVWQLLKQTATKGSADKVPGLGAALAYYTVFSVVPLLVIVIAIAGLVFGQQAAQSQIIEQIGGLVGEDSAKVIQGMIETARKPSTGLIATISALITLLLGASGVFGQLQDALNTISGVAESAEGFVQHTKQTFDPTLQMARHPWMMLRGALVVGSVFGTLQSRHTGNDWHQQVVPGRTLKRLTEVKAPALHPMEAGK